MAGIIHIKGRREPVEVETSRARKIKLLRFGDENGEGKADPFELIDLGDEWAGEIGQIRGVEIKKDAPPPVVRLTREQELEAWRKEQLAKPIEVRARELVWFEMAWWMRSRRKEKMPPENVLDDARLISLKYFKEHPYEPELPRHVLEPLLEKYWGKKPQSLGEQKRIIHREGDAGD